MNPIFNFTKLFRMQIALKLIVAAAYGTVNFRMGLPYIRDYGLPCIVGAISEFSQ